MSTAKSHAPAVVFILGGFAAFWICLVVLFAAQAMQVAPDQGWARAMQGSMNLWLPWIVVSPLMLLAACFLPIGSTRLRWFIPGHLLIAAALLYVAGWLARNVLPAPAHESRLALRGAPGPAGGFPPQPGMPGFGPPPGQDGYGPPPGARGFGPPGSYGPPAGAEPGAFQPGLPGAAANQPLMAGLMRTLPVGLPLYVVSLLIVGSLNLRRITLEKERRAAELETQLADARLETLRSQLHPHFLFNTLNALMALVHTDPAKAEEMILSLSSLLRATLEARDKPRIPLREELQLARDYLAIQSVRYGDRLQTREMLPSETLACVVPPLILQPVLENAIKYAIDRNAAGGSILLRAERLGEKLVLEVEDTGSGRSAEARESHGVGVASVRARLAAAFPGRPVEFALLPNQHGGITVRFQMPVEAEASDRLRP